MLSASQRVAEDLARARISNNSAEKDRFGKRRSDLYPSAENASVREFRSILRQVRKLKDWMVDGPVRCELVSSELVPLMILRANWLTL